jgi:uncharacterized integral membrane protein
MPWRLIGFIVLFGIFLVFIAFNLGNTCDINFGFRVFQQVPVFLTAFASFALGLFCAIPFILSFRLKKKDKPGKDGVAVPADKPAKKWGKKQEISELESPSEGDKGPYGIN